MLSESKSWWGTTAGWWLCGRGTRICRLIDNINRIIIASNRIEWITISNAAHWVGDIVSNGSLTSYVISSL